MACLVILVGFGCGAVQSEYYFKIHSFVCNAILTIYITVLVTRGRHFGALESV
jgi:hypothetical protein